MLALCQLHRDARACQAAKAADVISQDRTYLSHVNLDAGGQLELPQGFPRLIIHKLLAHSSHRNYSSFLVHNVSLPPTNHNFRPSQSCIRLQDAPTRLPSLSSVPWTPLMFAPPHNGDVSLLLASYDATSLIAPLATNGPSPTIITPERIRVLTPTDISDLSLTRGAPHAYIHPCPTY